MPDWFGDLLLWPFPAAESVSEVLEWRTDVLQARAGESAILCANAQTLARYA